MAWYDAYKEEKIVVQQEGNHNKFWAAHYDESTNTVYVRWGRFGTKGQSQEKKFGSISQAASFISDKYYEKKRKGYTDTDKQGNKIDHARFEMMCIEAAIVGTSNKCDALDWVELVESEPGVFDFAPIDQERLYSPECNPGLLVKFQTRKEYDNRNSFKFLFTFDNAYDVRDAKRAAPNLLVDATHPLHDLTTKVEEAIGRRLSTV